MKKILLMMTVLISSQSYGASSVTSKCVVKNNSSGSNSGIRDLTVINSNLGQSYNSQELVFEEFKVVFYNGTRVLNLLKNNKYVASVQAASLKSGNVITLEAFDSQTGQPAAHLSCKLSF